MTLENIHPDDLLYKYILQRHGPEKGRQRYFSGGREDTKRVALAATRLLKKEPKKVLEFASGYGRVTRHLRELFPNGEITASDIHPGACTFLSESFGIPTKTSSTSPSKVEVGSGYDFIFVLSLFSHLPHKTFDAWLRALSDALAPGGVMMFTTHGDVSRERFAGVDLSKEDSGEGWVYRRQSDQPDLDLEDYGTMIVEPRYVTGCIDALGFIRLKSFVAGPWFGHQDEWAVERVNRPSGTSTA